MHGTFHARENVYSTDSPFFLSATLRRTVLIAVIFPIPLSAAFSATFGSAMFSSLPSSQRPMTSSAVAASDTVMRQEGELSSGETTVLLP